MITQDGVVKLADVGLATGFSRALRSNKHEISSNKGLWYKSPEYLNKGNSGAAMDMWGAGCVMVEFWTRAPILQGNSEAHQLTLIVQLFGISLHNCTDGLIKEQTKKMEEYLFFVDVEDKNAIHLLKQLLAVSPSERPSANSALNHDFFWSNPMPCSLKTMLDSYNTNRQQPND